MKKLLVVALVSLAISACEYPIREINQWWTRDVLEQEEETATVVIGLSWPGDEEEEEQP